jgi:hypothetical protein
MQVRAELIRIEATLWGRFYPGFKEAPHASEGVLEGIASREGGERAPHTRVRHGQRGIRGAPRRVSRMLGVGCTPVLSRLVRPEGGLRAHGCRWVYTPRGTTIVRAQSCLSACIDTAVGGGP